MNALNALDSLGVESGALEHYRMLTSAGYGTESDNWRPDLAPDTRGPEFFGLEGAPDLDEYNEFGGWNPLKSIKSAVNSVAKVVSKVPGVSTITAPLKFVSNVAQGKNVVRSLGQAGTSIVRDTRSALPVAAGVVSFIPGVGTGVAAGISAVSAVSQGKNLRQIAEEAAIGAVPGGQLYKTAIQTGIDVARGGNVLKSVTNRGLEYARTQLPGGQVAQSALTAGINIAKGGNVVKSIATQGLTLARSQLPSTQALATAQRALSVGVNIAKGGNILAQVANAAPLAKMLTNSPLVKVGPNGAAFQFPAVGVPAAAAIAATTAVAEAAESTVPGIAAAARQVIANTKAEADRGNKGASVALGAIQQAIESRLALRNAKAQAASAMRTTMPGVPAGYRRALVGPTGQIIFQ
jgi:hypothetical protein